MALLVVSLPAPPRAGADPDERWDQVAAAADEDPVAAAALAVALLRSGSGEPPMDEQVQAHQLGLTLVAAGELAAAADLQVALHERVGAEWSAINAGLTLGNLGRSADADRLLAAQLDRTPRAAELWNRRGLVWLGAGETRLARRHLATAVRYGSVNAGLSLARLSLLDGDLEAARAGFRPGVAGSEPHAWALRGWARSLLQP